MEINLNNITFIIVSYKSNEVIFDCVNSLPSKSKKIVIENSNNKKLKNDLISKYDNIEVIMNENLGMGSSNNKGIERSNTQFVYILNPDVTFEDDTYENIEKSLRKISDFAILSPIHSNKNYPNYKSLKKNNFIDKNILEVDFLDGFSMLINLQKFNTKKIFDENIFLYLENDDLCIRAKKNNGKILIISNSYINHRGSSSTNIPHDELEYLRNWHWMWSKFYFNKKHFGYFVAVYKTYLNLLSGLTKYLFYFLTFKNHKKTIYKMRTLGIINAMLGKKSFFRIED